MKISNFINSSVLNELRLKMDANLVKKIDSGFFHEPLILVTLHKVEVNKFPKIEIVLDNALPLYSKDKSSPKIFHPIKNNTNGT